MNRIFSNPCIRCGTERIVLKRWKEKFGDSTVINTEMVCPNRECQKKVDLENKRQREKNAAMKLKSEQRALNRKVARNTKRKR